MKGIIVEWPWGKKWREMEYLDDINLDDLRGLERFKTTRAWWPPWDDNPSGRWVDYIAKTRVKRKDNRVIIDVTYKLEKNQDNPTLYDVLKDITWGTNRVIIEHGQDHGICVWKPGDGSRHCELKWRRKNLREPRDYRRSHQQVRDDDFRPQIIALDGQCVISGETETKTLDAAHIIPAAPPFNGNELRENGIALRADIHRLYDAGMFVIDPETGKPARISSKLSKSYRSLLKKSKGLPSETLKRVRETLRDPDADPDVRRARGYGFPAEPGEEPFE